MEGYKNSKVGQVYEFTNGYYVKTPYYAQVIYTCPDFFITHIPDKGICQISDSNYHYHSKRMRLIGTIEDHKSKLFNQKNLL
jgi:hypothetical protein